MAVDWHPQLEGHYGKCVHMTCIAATFEMQADGYAGALGMRAFVFSLVPLLLPIFIYLCFADKFFFALDVHPKMVGENLEKDYIHMCKNTHC